MKAAGRPRVVAWALVVLGAYLIAVPFALSLFTRTDDAETLADQYRSFGTEEGLAQFTEHTDIVVRGGEQLLDEALPAFVDDLGITDAELAERFPNIAVYQDRAPEVFAYLVPAVGAVASQADNIEEADDFPLPGVPVTAGPWALLAAGAVLVVVGTWTRAATGRQVPVLALVAGLGLAVGPLVLTWPSQVDAAEDVAEAARVAFTPAVAAATTADTYMIDAAVIELQQSMLPALDDDLQASIDADYPAVATFLDDWGAELSVSAHGISQSQIRFMDEFHNADATPYRALPWLFVVPGLVLAILAGLALTQLGVAGSKSST